MKDKQQLEQKELLEKDAQNLVSYVADSHKKNQKNNHSFAKYLANIYNIFPLVYRKILFKDNWLNKYNVYKDKILSNYSLYKHNTLFIKSKAERFAFINSEEELIELLKINREVFKLPVKILGNGSNVILPSKLKAFVLKVNTNGWHLISEDKDTVLISVEAGTNWHSFVKDMLMNGYHGLENLALIPGTVGASAVQNIGAYGVEVSSFIDSLDIIDLSVYEKVNISKGECNFSYRHSIFKELENKFIYKLYFKLYKNIQPNIEYSSLKEYFKNKKKVTHLDLFETVIKIRQTKMPDINKLGCAGSFFINPVITKDRLMEIQKIIPDILFWKSDENLFKIPAAALIDFLGWKRKKPYKGICVYEKHALIIINKRTHNIKNSDILYTAKEIQNAVYQHFGVPLIIEPVIL